jgi:hypothetical protein
MSCYMLTSSKSGAADWTLVISTHNGCLAQLLGLLVRLFTSIAAVFLTVELEAVEMRFRFGPSNETRNKAELLSRPVAL